MRIRSRYSSFLYFHTNLFLYFLHLVLDRIRQWCLEIGRTFGIYQTFSFLSQTRRPAALNLRSSSCIVISPRIRERANTRFLNTVCQIFGVHSRIFTARLPVFFSMSVCYWLLWNPNENLDKTCISRIFKRGGGVRLEPRVWRGETAF